MTTDNDLARAARRRATLMRMANVPMRQLLGLPFPTPLGGRLMLVTLTGRRTGRTYRQPLSYIRHGDTLLTPGGGKWKFNLVAGRTETMRLRGHDLTVTPEIVADGDGVERLLGIMVDANPSVAKFIPIPRDADGQFDRQKLRAAIDHGFCIVCWHLGAVGQAHQAEPAPARSA